MFGGIGATIRGPVSTDSIVIRGAREHNLKNLTLELPRDKLIVFTGISGSGKSSLAFDTIYAEGQLRYVESVATRPAFGRAASRNTNTRPAIPMVRPSHINSRTATGRVMGGHSDAGWAPASVTVRGRSDRGRSRFP